MTGRTISAEELDRRFDNGEDVSEWFDWENARRPGLEPRRVQLDVPTWIVEGLDREAHRRGVAPDALIKMWLADKLDQLDPPRRPARAEAAE